VFRREGGEEGEEEGVGVRGLLGGDIFLVEDVVQEGGCMRVRGRSEVAWQVLRREEDGPSSTTRRSGLGDTAFASASAVLRTRWTVSRVSW
jgi:hypothetical protein